MIANDASPFDGMDMDLLKQLREAARVNDMRNRVVLAQPERAFTCACGNQVNVTDRGARCRQCVLMGRMFDSDAA